MQLRVNGREISLPIGATGEGLLQQLGLHSERIAAERNGAILDRAQFSAAILTAGDVIEIVRFVGGG